MAINQWNSNNCPQNVLRTIPNINYTISMRTFILTLFVSSALILPPHRIVLHTWNNFESSQGKSIKPDRTVKGKIRDKLGLFGTHTVYSKSGKTMEQLHTDLDKNLFQLWNLTCWRQLFSTCTINTKRARKNGGKLENDSSQKDASIILLFAFFVFCWLPATLF